MVGKRKTREQLELELAREIKAHGESDQERRELRDRARAQRAETDDLKERLAAAEAENARMRGYIARVQEDDVVREDLVPIGDPAGEQQLVPKRKPTPFQAPLPYSTFSGGDVGGAMSSYRERDRPKPKHWVTY